MKNKIKILSATVLIFSLLFSVFTACSPESNETETGTQAAETSKIHATDYTYNTVAAATEDKTEYVHTVPPIPTEKEETKSQTKHNITPSLQSETTKKAPSDGKVDELSNGLSIITKTSPVIKGNSATVVIQGTPGAEYTIEFYKNETEKASYEGIDKTAADPSGFASWTFTVEDDCESGNRKIIIKEINSKKYIQTSITVQ